ncbi:MAG: hypothetical protein Q3M24_14105 [Candidatus Electrothrix aestuarii]|uniref:Uncharacterized protein n=1 Tax=Candidatus Electrothrix aestuarii TaxID=3062594 RepID=A0AAU8LPM7_9BACT|nr:hypothetical protein [Candidatus Electrothrix aestuarii]
MSNQFESKGRDQNVGQGEGAIGKQINNYYTGAPPTPAEATCSLPAEDAVFLHRKEELAWLDEHLHPDRVVAVCGPGGNPFPQLIEARMEAFCLQAERLNEQMLACR